MTKKKVKLIAKKHIDKLLLQDWDINFIMSKEYDDDEGGAARVRTNHTYKWATITIYKCAFEEPNNISNIINHELCHCLADPLQKYCYDFLNGKFRTPDDINEQRELLTEWISRITR